MSPKIIEDRLTNRGRVLRTRWHSEGELLLKAGKYVEFADGLLRLMRQLDAITATVAAIASANQPGGMFGFSGPSSASTRSRANRPSGRPIGSAS